MRGTNLCAGEQKCTVPAICTTIERVILSAICVFKPPFTHGLVKLQYLIMIFYTQLFT